MNSLYTSYGFPGYGVYFSIWRSQSVNLAVSLNTFTWFNWLVAYASECWRVPENHQQRLICACHSMFTWTNMTHMAIKRMSRRVNVRPGGRKCVPQTNRLFFPAHPKGPQWGTWPGEPRLCVLRLPALGWLTPAVGLNLWLECAFEGCADEWLDTVWHFWL